MANLNVPIKEELMKDIKLLSVQEDRLIPEMVSVLLEESPKIIKFRKEKK